MAEPEPVTNAKATGESTAAIDDASITDLRKDPFLLEDKQRSKPTTKPTRSMKMPWLDQTIEITAEYFESEEHKKPSQASDVALDNADKPPMTPPQQVQSGERQRRRRRGTVGVDIGASTNRARPDGPPTGLLDPNHRGSITAPHYKG